MGTPDKELLEQGLSEPSVPVSKLRELFNQIASKRYFPEIEELESLIASAEKQA